MSILFLDGAERNSNNKWTVNAYSPPAVSNTSLGGIGNYCYRIDNGEISKTLSISYSALYFSFKYRNNNAAEGTWIMHFKDSGGTVTFSIKRNVTSGLIEIRIGDGGTLLDTGDVALAYGVTYLIEVYYKPLNSGGECTVKVNGAADATYTGDTTAGLENVQEFHFGKAMTSSYYYLDDVVVSDSGWLGNQYIQAIVPNGAGSLTQWDPSTGSNYACVDEVTASDTDYVSTNVTDEIDLYGMSNLTGTIGSITAIDICARMAYEGNPTPTKQKIAYKSGATTAYGSDISSGLSFIDYFSGPIATNPDDSAAWEEADINALECGVKAIA